MVSIREQWAQCGERVEHARQLPSKLNPLPCEQMHRSRFPLRSAMPGYMLEEGRDIGKVRDAWRAALRCIGRVSACAATSNRLKRPLNVQRTRALQGALERAPAGRRHTPSLRREQETSHNFGVQHVQRTSQFAWLWMGIRAKPSRRQARCWVFRATPTRTSPHAHPSPPTSPARYSNHRHPTRLAPDTNINDVGQGRRMLPIFGGSMPTNKACCRPSAELFVLNCGACPSRPRSNVMADRPSCVHGFLAGPMDIGDGAHPELAVELAQTDQRGI